MQEHEFNFGSAVQGVRLRDDNPAYATYKAKVAELFNMATLENDLKWPPWNGEWGSDFTQAGAQNAINWLNSQSINVRGHTLVWPGYDNLPQTMKNVLNGAPLDAAEQQQVRILIAAHIADEAGRFAGQLAAWDVINETRTNHDVMDNLSEGNLAMVHWFQQARAADPHAKLFLNDYGILSSGGGTNTANQQQYFDTLEYLIDYGAPIDGVGFQGHFSPDSLTGPEQLWTIFDRFAELGLDMQVTEFDLSTDDEELQAMYTRDLMTAVFAQEGFDAFVMWGFWAGAHWRPEAAMYRSDWSIKPNGEEYLDLVFNQWWTDEDEVADEDGEALIRGFKGEYEVTAEFGEFDGLVATTLGVGGRELLLSLPFLLGDYNRDGSVDAGDYTVWRNSLGNEVAAGTAADGDGDGRITQADFGVWKRNFGAVLPGGAGGMSSVPEPTAWAIAAMALGSIVIRRSRRR
jgi:GH35 family endo-1,4-beta-xylanase